MTPQAKKRATWLVVLLLIANEIRGVLVVGAILKGYFGWMERANQ